MLGCLSQLAYFVLCMYQIFSKGSIALGQETLTLHTHVLVVTNIV
jgi:hypothetical protein